MMDTLLRTIFIQHAGLPFSIERLEGNIEMGICGGELRAAIPFLLQQGKLEAIKNRSGEVSFRIKEEILPTIANQLIEDVPSYPYFEVELYRESGSALIYTVLGWLQWIYYNELPFTSKGTLHRKTILALHKITPFEDHKLAGLNLQLVAHQEMPLGISFMLDILVQMSILHLGANGWKIDDDRLQSWLGLDLKSANESLLYLLCKAYVPALKYQQQAISLITCPSVRQGNYYSAVGIMRQLNLTQQQLQLEQETWLSSCLYVLCRCGWLEQGKNGQDAEQPLFRWCAGIEEHSLPVSEEIVVQPDFEILVPPYVSLQTRFHLELMTEHIQTDVMSRYRLTKNKYSLAIQAGLSWTLDQIELPMNVTLAMTQWTKEGEASYARSDVTLTNKHIHSKNQMQALAGFINIEYKLPLYQIDDFKPQLSQIMPGIHTVPVKWMQELASYHQSTLRHLVEQALMWQIKIQLQLEDDTICMIPTVVTDEEQDWYIVGLTKSKALGAKKDIVQKSVHYKECQGIRLLVPEFMPRL